MEWVCTNPWSGCAQTHGVHGAGMGSRLHLSVHRALCCTCTHDTHTHTYTHIHTHTHIYTHIHTHIHTNIRSHTHFPPSFWLESKIKPKKEEATLSNNHCNRLPPPFAAVTSGANLAQLLYPQPSSPPHLGLPCLRRLRGGWGMCAPTLRMLLCAPGRSHALRALELGVGAGELLHV